MATKKHALTALIFAFCLSFGLNAFAGGAFYIYPQDTGGSPYKWDGGNIHWRSDAGNLSSNNGTVKIPGPTPDIYKSLCKTIADPCAQMDKCGAIMCVDFLFKRWATAQLVTAATDSPVKAAQINVTYDGMIDGNTDINAENYSTYKDQYNGLAEKGTITPILVIFDEDGSIIEAEAGPNQEKYLLGLTDPLRDPTLKTGFYTGGIMIFNGLFINGKLPNTSDSNDREPSLEVSNVKFASSMLHEIGHAMGLDHSQGLRAANGSSETGTDNPDGIPTMYPQLLNFDSTHEGAQYDLHTDDIVALASLYPTDYFINKFCTIRGELQHSNKDPYQGVNVITYSTDDDKFMDSRSFVSGSIYPPSTKNGQYVLNGIVPCKKYTIVYEAVWKNYQQWRGGINPYDGNMIGPDENDITSGVTITVGGYASDTAICNPNNLCDTTPIPATYSAKGQVINADPASSVPEATDSASDTGKKGWCMSIAGGFSPIWGLIVPALAICGFAARSAKQRKKKA